MRIADFRFPSRRFFLRCVVVVLVALTIESLSLRLLNPQSAIRNPHSHKFHVSVAAMEYNPKAQSVEVVLRVYADDLENALSQHAKRPIKLDPTKSKEAGEVVMAYLRSQFELKTAAGKPVKFTWVGLEAQVDMFWLYFEGKLAGGLAGAQLKNRVFCELFEDQVNIVNAKYQGKQMGTMFEAKDGFKLLASK